MLLGILAAYAMAGSLIAVAFVLFGLARVLPHVSVTPGALLVVLPGIIILWPLVLCRWLKPRRRQ